MDFTQRVQSKKVVLRLKTLNIVWKLNDVPFGVCFLLIVCFSFKNKYINAKHLCVHDKTIISEALAREARQWSTMGKKMR